MRWALQLLALAQFAVVAVFGVLTTLTNSQTQPHRTALVLQMLLSLLAQTGFYLGVIACVAAIVASLLLGERRWAMALIVLLLLALYALPVIQDVLPNISFTSSWLRPLLALSADWYRFTTELAPGLVLALVVLVFSFWSFWRYRPAASGSAQDAGVGGSGGGPGTTGTARAAAVD